MLRIVARTFAAKPQLTLVPVIGTSGVDAFLKLKNRKQENATRKQHHSTETHIGVGHATEENANIKNDPCQVADNGPGGRPGSLDHRAQRFDDFGGRIAGAAL